MPKAVAGATVITGSLATTFEITADMVSGAYCMVRQTIAPGQLFWPHVHANEDQVIIVLERQLGARVGEREWTSGPGSVVHRPKGVPHTVWNAGREPVVMLEITSPGAFESYFAEQGEMTASGNWSKRGELLQRCGISGVDGWSDGLRECYGVVQS